MKSPKPDRERAPLEAERARLLETVKGLRKQIAEHQEAFETAERKLQRLTIVELIGVPDGVKVRFRNMFEDSRVDDAVGVVVEVKRTKCLVDFGPLGRWRLAIGEVMPTASGDPQGFQVPLPGCMSGGAR